MSARPTKPDPMRNIIYYWNSFIVETRAYEGGAPPVTKADLNGNVYTRLVPAGCIIVPTEKEFLQIKLLALDNVKSG